MKGWKTQPVPDNLVNQINQKIIQAYNSTDYLNGYYEKLMKQFLNREVAGTEEDPLYGQSDDAEAIHPACRMSRHGVPLRDH